MLAKCIWDEEPCNKADDNLSVSHICHIIWLSFCYRYHQTLLYCQAREWFEKYWFLR